MRNAPPSPFDQFRAMLGEPARAMRKGPQLRVRDQAPAKPIPGSLAALTESMKWAHSLEGVPEWQSGPSQSIDQVWSRLTSECVKRFGTAPSLDEADHSDPGVVQALRRAVEAEGQYLRLAGASHAGGDAMKAALGTFTAAVAKFANVATAGWPSANERARAARREARWR